MSTSQMTTGSTAAAKKIPPLGGLCVLDANRERGACREELNVFRTSLKRLAISLENPKT